MGERAIRYSRHKRTRHKTLTSIYHAATIITCTVAFGEQPTPLSETCVENTMMRGGKRERFYYFLPTGPVIPPTAMLPIPHVVKRYFPPLAGSRPRFFTPTPSETTVECFTYSCFRALRFCAKVRCMRMSTANPLGTPGMRGMGGLEYFLLRPTTRENTHILLLY